MMIVKKNNCFCLYYCIDRNRFFVNRKSSPKECVNSILAQTQIKRPLDLGLVY